jgi:hypothetical protein
MSAIMNATHRHPPVLRLAVLLAALPSLLVACGDWGAHQSRAVFKSEESEVTIQRPRVDFGAEQVHSPAITFRGYGEQRMTGVVATVFQDLDGDGQRGPEEPTYVWQREWKSGSGRKEHAPAGVKPLKGLERIREGTFRYEVEITFTSGGTCFSSGEAERTNLDNP